MGNMPAVDKVLRSVQLPRLLLAKLDHRAKETGFNRNQIINMILDEGTKDVELTNEEIDEVNRKIKEARDARKNRR